jgi:nucleoside-diphosphate-sugar epimerase
MTSSGCLVTGATGFVGRHLVDALGRDTVTALSRRPLAGCRTVVADLCAPDLSLPGPFQAVYHAAGHAHVSPRTAREAQRFFEVNVDGLAHVLAALERAGRLPESFVLVSSVAVYGREEGELIEETAPRQALDPYGCSKRIAEDLLADWCSRREVRCTIVRLPLVAGPNAPGNFGSFVRGLRSRRYLGVGNGAARRSIVLAREVGAVLPVLARRGGTYHLTDGDHPTIAALERALAEALARRPPRRLPVPVVAAAARVGDVLQRVSRRPLPLNSRMLRKLTTTLTFSDVRARLEVNWRPSRVIDHGRELL